MTYNGSAMLPSNATVVDDAIRFVSSKSKENLKTASSSNSDEHKKEESKEPDYDEDDEDQLEEEQEEQQTTKMTPTTNAVF
ncbi:MAG: hypothetical protein ACJ71H_06890 [Nitrososphaeraceae archaeon]